MSNKKVVSLAIAIAACYVLAVFIKPGAEALWASFRDFTNPHYYDIKLKEWSNKSTDFLIDKLGHPAPIWDGAAGNILANRKDLTREDKLVRIIESSSSTKKRTAALGVLFCWDDIRSTNISAEILKAGDSHPLYKDAILHLAHRHNDIVFPQLEAMAKSPEKFNNGSVGYLEDFGLPKAIPILEEMLHTAEISNSDERMVRNAIHSIKEKNGIPN